MAYTPQQLLSDMRKVFPGALEYIDYVRSKRGTTGDILDWPIDWCYAPSLYWSDIAAHTMGAKQHSLDTRKVGSRVAAVLTWAYTRGVYRIDQDAELALVNSGYSGKIPCDVLCRLPEWSSYVETPGWFFGKRAIAGFWVCNDFGSNKDGGELRWLNILINSADSDHLESAFLPLRPCTVDEAVSDVLKSTKAACKEMGWDEDLESAAQSEWYSDCVAFLSKAIPILLYICSDEPDIDDERKPGSRPQIPQPRKTKKGWRLFPATNDRVWTVGAKVGATLREAAAKEYQGGTKRPHLRRGHWHGYWTGPRTSEQKFSYRWIAPTVVSGAL